MQEINQQIRIISPFVDDPTSICGAKQKKYTYLASNKQLLPVDADAKADPNTDSGISYNEQDSHIEQVYEILQKKRKRERDKSWRHQNDQSSFALKYHQMIWYLFSTCVQQFLTSSSSSSC